jgi:D-xylose transport system permease protein
MTTGTSRPTTPATQPALADSGSTVAQDIKRRLKGDLGPLPVLASLVVIAVVFQSFNSRFLSPANVTNLLLQVAATGTIALGIFLVLLLGEIDLSAGSVSGVGGASLAVLTVKEGYPPIIGIAVALALGALIGLLQGAVFARFGVPSFVVTLAGLIGWQGLQLHLLGTTGTINLPSSIITQLTDTYLQRQLGWLIAALSVLAMMASSWHDRRARRRLELPIGNLWETSARTTAAALAIIAILIVLNRDRGVPLAALLLIALVVVVDMVTRHTRFGRRLLAVGGNIEAARRAGVRVNGLRVAVFTLSGLFAAAGGIMAASRLISVDQASGSGDLLLDAIAAVVIGGTSLFGGRGNAWSALLGVLVLGGISNGMDLVGFSSDDKFMITGAVLLLAVTVDAISRRGRATAGIG